MLVGTANYTYSPNHASLADIPALARIAVSGTLTGRTVAANVFDADDVVFLSVSGNPANAAVLVKYTGVDVTSPLIAYLDQAASGLPVNPSGGNITIQWSSGSNKIFAL